MLALQRALTPVEAEKLQLGRLRKEDGERPRAESSGLEIQSAGSSLLKGFI